MEEEIVEEVLNPCALIGRKLLDGTLIAESGNDLEPGGTARDALVQARLLATDSRCTVSVLPVVPVDSRIEKCGVALTFHALNRQRGQQVANCSTCESVDLDGILTTRTRCREIDDVLVVKVGGQILQHPNA